MRDGRIAALGEDALAARTRRTEVVELHGGCLRPGFRDGHAHPLWGARSLLGAPVAGAATLDDLLDRVRAYADAHPALDWITGACYDPTVLPGGVGDARWLDDACGERPALLWATDHHTAWVSSAALRAAGFDASTPDPARGRIVRRDDGSPSGTLLEDAAHIVAALAPKPSVADERRALAEVSARFAAAGVTWVQDAALRPHELDHYRALADDGQLACGVHAALIADPTRWESQVDELVATSDAHATTAVRAGTIKLFADGVIEMGTAALVEPYCDCAAGAGGHHGVPNWPPDELARAVVAFDARGFQVHIHAIGDAGVRAALDAVEAAVRANGRRDRRPVIAHTQLVQPTDLARFAALGVVANFEPLWAQQDALMTELTEPRLGAERSSWQYPMGALLRSGAALSFGSDWPVSSLAPLDGLAVAVTRQTGAGEPPDGWLPDQRLALSDALAAYTVGSAHQAFAPTGTGRLALGAAADLVLLAAPPEEVAPHELPQLPVLGTWVEGREVYRA